MYNISQVLEFLQQFETPLMPAIATFLVCCYNRY